MKKNICLLFASLLALVSCGGNNDPIFLTPNVDEVRLLFNHGKAGVDQYYNYCPTVFIENNEKHVYYCTNKDAGNVTDYVGYRKGIIENNKIVYSELDFVMEHGKTGEWDSRHICDPSVVKGEFTYNNETYNYLMAYLACSSSDVTLNETGIAVSKTPEGPWIKCDYDLDGTTKINPVVPVSDFTSNQKCWGTGQPSLVSVDKKGVVLLFTSVGTENATFTNLRKFDFSNINDYKILDEQRSIMNTGVRGTASGAGFINNADFAYDLENERLLMIKGRQHYGTDGKEPSFIADTLDVYYIDDTEKDGVGEVIFAGNNTTKQWKLIGSIGQDLTGFLRNHNSGFITNEYGHLLNTESLPVAFTRSDQSKGGGTQWSFLCTYRIYETALNFPKSYFPK